MRAAVGVTRVAAKILFDCGHFWSYCATSRSCASGEILIRRGSYVLVCAARDDNLCAIVGAYARARCRYIDADI